MKENTKHVSSLNKNDSKKAANEKKKFYKKKYRLETYSNKYKVNQWQERRKKAILRNYCKELRKEQQQNTHGLQGGKDQPKIEFKNETSQPKPKLSAFEIAKREYERKKQEKQQKQEEAERRKAEKEEALKKYKQKKIETYKKLSKKTKKGQPVMKGRIEHLLDKIQQSVQT